MNIQIISFGKSFDTQKAIRFFKERKINFQLVELSSKRKISNGELNALVGAIGLEALINSKSKAYTQQNIAYHGYSETTKNMIIDYPDLMHMPIVRNGKEATVGYCPDVWLNWK